MLIKSLKEIGKLVRKQRVNAQVSGADLAEKINTSQAMISRIENGKANVTISTLLKTAKALGKRLDIRFK